MAGVYVHIPFCKSRCRYCDFYSTTQLGRRGEYVDAMIEEWVATGEQTTKANNTDDASRVVSQTPATQATLAKGTTLTTRATSSPKSVVPQAIETIYIGGGTPSLLEVEDLRRLLGVLPVAGTKEVTIEANPGDITHEKARAWRAMGVTRLSIGIQSFNDDMLRLIGRRHTAEQAREAVRIAREEGFENISADLIYGLPHAMRNAAMEVLKRDVEELLRLEVEHISTYCLSYEEGTAMTRMLERGEIEEVDEDTENRMFDYIVEQLTKAGYEHYEVSNFARPGRRSRHNSSYWNDTPYIGLGAGAHSYDGVHRYWNPSDIDLYIKGALAHDLQREQETLTDEQRHTERVMLGLRTAEGIAQSDVDEAKALPYLRRGLLRTEGNRLVATTEGYHILNRIIEDLI